MLKIQRASAGSGKTYALAKNFILNLIAYKNQKGKWIIRNEQQIADALTHILAITFTNKATNEMKERIINNLSQLSQAKNISEALFTKNSNIPYLQEFHEITGADYKKIGEASHTALKTILNDFSLFKISTIDSFFQEILRTFTFEANINDSYQLEIDSTFVNDTAIDTAMHQLDSRPQTMGNAKFWLKTIMRKESRISQRWNIFNKKSGNGSLYSKLRNALTQLESEDFKEVKEELDEFFSNPAQSSNLVGNYKKLQTFALEERENLLKNIKKTASHLESIILKNNYLPAQLNKTFLSHLNKAASLKINDVITFEYHKIQTDGSVFLKKFRSNGNPLDVEALNFYDLISEWKSPSASSYYKSWKIYGELLPYLGLILEIKSYLAKVLDTNNLIQISDTGFILKKIIGDDDSSFVYERLGNRIDHYLIDEFQDTSGMQWDIIHPLLVETESKGNESLIIGDPKQSIYRFRNADHTLITEVVPQSFPDHMAAGFTKEDNTNWRSHTEIVKFNNFFFKSLASLINQISQEKGGSTDFERLYSNVVQYPHRQEGKGYVEIRMFEKTQENKSSLIEDNEGEEGNTRKDWFDEISLANLGPLVSSLIKRGYKPKDIGVLVNTNDKGKEVVESFIAYNETLTSTAPRIDFISEESLLVSSSPAVELIVGVIEKIIHPLAKGSGSEVKPKDKNGRPEYFNWNQVKLDYTLYSMTHSHLSAAEKIYDFLANSRFDDSITKLLESMPTPSIASIVESVAGIFLDESLKKSDALYIASFQDLVNEYLQSHPDDPASFMEWWNSKGSRMAVASPDGINAVQIMTIHKSKGLEFKCVILPFATDSFTPSPQKDEWRWVTPVTLNNIELPPVVPVKTNSELKGSAHEISYFEYYDQVLTDKLNMYYVAFTRAKNELYIFTKKSDKKTPDAIHDFLQHILTGKYHNEGIFCNDEDVITLEDLNISTDKSIITLGVPFSEEEIIAENIKDMKKEEAKREFFQGYYVNKKRPRLKSLASRVLPSGELSK